jgi:hypothetical protein
MGTIGLFLTILGAYCMISGSFVVGLILVIFGIILLNSKD